MSQTEMPPAGRMLQMITGLWVSLTVGTLARLGVAVAVANGATTSDDVALRCG
jgi:hypothetical protein